jgi:hypothetical protein
VIGLDTPDADGFAVFEGHGTCIEESEATDASSCGSSGAEPTTKPDTPPPPAALDCATEFIGLQDAFVAGPPPASSLFIRRLRDGVRWWSVGKSLPLADGPTMEPGTLYVC